MTDQGNIIFTDGKELSSCIHLACNASPSEVYAYLAEMDRRGNCNTDLLIESSLLTEVVCEFLNLPEFTGRGVNVIPVGETVTLESLHEIKTDSSGNGFYIVNRSPKRRNVRRFRRGVEYSEGVPEIQKEEVIAEYAEATQHPNYRYIGELFKTTKHVPMRSKPITAKWGMEIALEKQARIKAKREYKSFLKTIDARTWF